MLGHEIFCICLLVRVKEYASVIFLLVVLVEFTGTMMLIMFNCPNLWNQTRPIIFVVQIESHP